MNIEKMREEFEAWCKSKYPNSHFGICKKEDGYRFSIGQYIDADVHTRWESWQASRESLVFNTGELADENTCPLSVESYWIKQIEAAGLKVKS